MFTHTYILRVNSKGCLCVWLFVLFVVVVVVVVVVVWGFIKIIGVVTDLSSEFLTPLPHPHPYLPTPTPKIPIPAPKLYNEGRSNVMMRKLKKKKKSAIGSRYSSEWQIIPVMTVYVSGSFSFQPPGNERFSSVRPTPQRTKSGGEWGGAGVGAGVHTKECSQCLAGQRSFCEFPSRWVIVDHLLGVYLRIIVDVVCVSPSSNYYRRTLCDYFWEL